MKKPVKYYVFPDVPRCLARKLLKDYDLADWRVWHRLVGTEFAVDYKRNRYKKRGLDHSMPIR